jgi:hypothetical protein
MPLTKINFRPGLNRENTRYTTEGGWYECDKVRFRQGTPEKIGGWARISANTFLGTCRSLWNWVTLGALNLMGVGTNVKFYIEAGGAYNDITPIRSTTTLTNPFTAANGSSTLLVTQNSHGAATGAYVTFSGAALTGLGGTVTAAVLTAEYAVTVLTSNTYTITLPVTANATDAAGSPGGGTVIAQFQINAGEAAVTPAVGWGSGWWGESPWGGSPGTAVTSTALRVWNQDNFGEDLVFGPNGGAIYYWDATSAVAATTMTVTIASPGVATFTFAPTEGMPLYFNTTGALPTGLVVGTVYYATNVSGRTANLALTYGGAAINTSGSQSGVHSVSARGYNISVLPGATDVPTSFALACSTASSRGSASASTSRTKLANRSTVEANALPPLGRSSPRNRGRRGLAPPHARSHVAMLHMPQSEAPRLTRPSGRGSASFASHTSRSSASSTSNSAATMSNPSCSCRKRTSRWRTVQNSSMKCAPSPSATTRASPMNSRSGSRSSSGAFGSMVERRTALVRSHAAAAFRSVTSILLGTRQVEATRVFSAGGELAQLTLRKLEPLDLALQDPHAHSDE